MTKTSDGRANLRSIIASQKACYVYTAARRIQVGNRKPGQLIVDVGENRSHDREIGSYLQPTTRKLHAREELSEIYGHLLSGGERLIEGSDLRIRAGVNGQLRSHPCRG